MDVIHAKLQSRKANGGRCCCTISSTVQAGGLSGGSLSRFPSSSYVNDSGVVMLYSEILKDGKWLSFAKGSIGELRREIR